MSDHGSGDNHSTFSNDEGPPFTVSLTQLEALVSQHVEKPFQLRKLAEGGYHKVAGSQTSLGSCSYHTIGVQNCHKRRRTGGKSRAGRIT
jgi:hypothetical protein